MTPGTPRDGQSKVRKKFQPGEYVVVNTGSGDRVAKVVDDWWTTLPHEVRLDFNGNGSRMDVWQDSARLATSSEVADRGEASC